MTNPLKLCFLFFVFFLTCYNRSQTIRSHNYLDYQKKYDRIIIVAKTEHLAGSPATDILRDQFYWLLVFTFRRFGFHVYDQEEIDIALQSKISKSSPLISQGTDKRKTKEGTGNDSAKWKSATIKATFRRQKIRNLFPTPLYFETRLLVSEPSFFSFDSKIQVNCYGRLYDLHSSSLIFSSSHSYSAKKESSAFSYQASFQKLAKSMVRKIRFY